MRWLNLELIKAQLRIELDFDDEDAILILYGEAAEDTLLNYVGMSYEEVMEKYGKMPMALVQASLMLVDNSYQHRSPASPQNMYFVLYGFDTLVKPYIRLSSNETENRKDYGFK